jgi:hypothetical protein
MKFRHTIQLGAALLLLILIYFGQQMLATQSQEIAQEAKKVFAFEAASIRKLTIGQLGAVPTGAARQDDGTWSFTEPNPEIRPNSALWDRVATQLAGLMVERSLPDSGTDLDTYGLMTPRLTVSAEIGGTDHTLNFGYLEPTQSFRYTQLDGGNVFLVDKNVFFELDRPLDLLRDSFILDSPQSAIVHLEFARYMTAAQAEKLENPPSIGEESSVIVVEREDDTKFWEQLAPVHVAANEIAVNDLVAEIQHARGRSHIDAPESLADYGLDPPVARITVIDADGRYPQTVFFGDTGTDGDTSGVYARREGEPSVFLMDGHILTLFPNSPNSFRERHLLTRAKNLTRVEQVSSDEGYILELSEKDGWQMVQPALDDTDQFYVNQFINAFKMIEGTRFYAGQPAEYGLDEPEMRFLMTVAGEDEPLEVRLVKSADVEGHYYATTDFGEVASLPEEHVEFLLHDAQTFRDRALLRFDRRRAIRLDFGYEGTDYTLALEHNRWLVTAPEGFYMPNQRDAADLMAAVAELRAVGAEDENEAALAEYGFDSPRFTFTVTLAPNEGDEDPEFLGPLIVGGVVPGLDQQRFARSASRSGVFRIRQSFIETAQSALRGIRPQPGAVGN